MEEIDSEETKKDVDDVDTISALQRDLSLLAACLDNAMGQINWNCPSATNLPTNTSTPQNILSNDFQNTIHGLAKDIANVAKILDKEIDKLQDYGSSSMPRTMRIETLESDITELSKQILEKKSKIENYQKESRRIIDKCLNELI